MLAVKRGESQSMGILFERHHRQAFGFFVRTIGDPAASEDLVQNLFIRMLKYRGSYRGESRFTTWMYQIAVNLKNDYFQASSRRPIELSEDMPDRALLPGSEEIHESRLALLEQAFEQLSEADRTVLSLCKFQRLSGREVAAVLGISVGAVKVRVHRALSRLRKRCHEMEGGPGDGRG